MSNIPLMGGLPKGTPILTLDGFLPVEYLTPGDRIITRNSGSTQLCGHVVRTVRVHAVRLAMNALGEARPEQTFDMPADQHILLRGPKAEALSGQPQTTVPVGFLVNDETIRDLGEVDMVLHHLVFERMQVVYAGGLEVLGATGLPQHVRPAA
ncbi:Hint domain-containing protein [Thalassococcus sp. S3]|uniref:Hint domain-containing protein n=1 Tax=Thalassococcus sp. S3 TaxID=2017482 RepID=UPI0013EE7C55|nr:Hint domain-containing protein [Thalassococcus sp. S3]